MKHILIVDDEQHIRRILSDGLAPFSDEFKVVTADNGNVAIHVMSARHIDLVITDLQMPTMDGLQLLAYLVHNKPTLPVIVMTACGSVDIEARVREMNAFGYLEKPIHLKVLVEAIRRGLAETSKGYIQGITLMGFLQLLQMERKTCSVKVSSKGRAGLFHFADGDLISAELDGRTGEAVALELVQWPDPEIEIHYSGRPAARTIDAPLNHLLMEAMRLKDEAEEKSRRDPAARALDVGPSVPDEVEVDLDDPPEAGAAVEGSGTAAVARRALTEILRIEGALAAALVDVQSGMCLDGVSDGNIDIDLAAAAATEVVRAQQRAMKALGGASEPIEDILITLARRYQILRPLSSNRGVFLYLCLDRTLANLALARHQLAVVEAGLRL